MKRENLELAQTVIKEIEKKEKLLREVKDMIDEEGDIYINAEIVGSTIAVAIPKDYQDHSRRYLEHIHRAISEELKSLEQKLLYL